MLLVGQLDSPFVRRVAVSMTLLGRPFERDRSSVFGNFEEVSRINPLGRVPALVLDDGTVLVDSIAIRLARRRGRTGTRADAATGAGAHRLLAAGCAGPRRQREAGGDRL
jgi:glutathione S-transferase